jgi:hypothetical protein
MIVPARAGLLRLNSLLIESFIAGRSKTPLAKAQKKFKADA